MASRYFNKTATDQIGISPNALKMTYVEISQPVAKELNNIYVCVSAGVTPLVVPVYYQVRVWVCTQKGNFDSTGLNAATVSPLKAGSVATQDSSAIGNIGDVLFEQVVTCNPSYEITFSKPLTVEDGTSLYICSSYSIANGETDGTAATRYVILSANGMINNQVKLNYKPR